MQAVSTRQRGALAQRAAAAASQLLLRSPHDYSASLLRTVQFCADDVRTRCDASHHDGNEGNSEDDVTRAELIFPWRATAGALNGFRSAHGGALSTLADVFTTLHARSAVDATAATATALRTVSFDVNFLNAIYEDAGCVCVTRLVHAQPGAAVFVEFAFESAQSREVVYTRGTHVLAPSSS